MNHAQRIALPMTRDTGFNRQSLLGVRAWQPHGSIAHLLDRKCSRAVRTPDKPVVDVVGAHAGLNVPVVDVDRAAAHFVKPGYKTCGSAEAPRRTPAAANRTCKNASKELHYE